MEQFFSKKLGFKILKISGIVLTLFLILLFSITAYIYFNKDSIYQNLISDLNKNHEGEFEIEKIEVAPFRNFPYISIDLKNTKLFDNKDKTSIRDTILSIKDVYVGFDVFDLIRGEYTIKKIKLSGGHLDLEKDSLGEYDLVKALAPIEDTDTTESSLHLDLQKIEVKDLVFREQNKFGNKYLELVLKDVQSKYTTKNDNLDVLLSGDFSLNEFTSNNVTYFKNKDFSLKTELEFDSLSGFMILHPGELIVENGSLDFEGKIDTRNDMDLHIEINGQKKNFDLFISFAPEDIYEKLKRFKNEGEIYFKGLISGPSLNQSPSINVELGCKNTMFFNKQAKTAVKDIEFVGRFTTGADNTLETSEFELTKLYGVPETGAFKGTFRVKNFVNPIVSMDFHAKLDLENLKTFYEFDWLENGSGRVEIDVTVDEFVDSDSTVHVATQLEDGTNSKILFKNVSIKHVDYHHALEKVNGKIELIGDNLQIEDFSMKVADSDFKFDLKLDNLTSYLHHYEAPIDLFLHGESKKINLAKVLPANVKDSAFAFKDEVITDFVFDLDIHTKSSDLENFNYFPKSKLYFRKLKFKLKNYPHELSSFYGKIAMSDERLDIEDISVKLGKNDFACSAHVNNPAAAVDMNKPIWVDFYADIKTNYFDMKELLVYNGKPLMGEEIDKEIPEEVLHDFEFEGTGKYLANSISENGLMGSFDIKTVKGHVNNMPNLGKTTGHFEFDTIGNITLTNFSTSIGKSDFSGDLFFRNVLSPNPKTQTYVKGKLVGKLWDFDNMVSYNAPPPEIKAAESGYVNHDSGFNIFVLPFPISDLKVEVAKINYHRYLLSDVNMKIRSNKDHYIFIDTLEMKAAGGSVALSGFLNGSDKNNIYSSLLLNLSKIEIGQLFYKFDNFGQDFLIKENVDGVLSAIIKAKIKMHTDLTVDMSDAIADMEVKIENGYLRNFAPMHAMAEFLGDKNFDNIRFGELENTLNFKNGKLNIPKMQINSTLGYIKVSGQQYMSTDMKYEIQVPLSLVKQAGWHMVKSKLQRSKNKTSEKELEEAEQEIISGQSGLVKGYMTFSITGNSDDFNVKLGKSR